MARSPLRVTIQPENARSADRVGRGLAGAGFELVGEGQADLALVIGESRDEETLGRCQALAAREPAIPVVLLDESQAAEPFETLSARGVFLRVPRDVEVRGLGDLLTQAVHHWECVRAARSHAEGLKRLERTARIAHFQVDLNDDRLHCSEALFELLEADVARDVLSLEDLLALVHEDDRAAFGALLRVREQFSKTLRLVGTLGDVRSVQANGQRFGSELVCVLEDVSRQHNALRQAEELSRIDPLTGLGNRRLFAERFDGFLRRARDQGRCAALLYIDLDRFKLINDSLGHAAGDELLQVLAARFMERVRLTDVVCRDAEGTVLSRLGGDEFAILVTDLDSPENAGEIARRLLECAAEPVPVSDRELAVSASIGIALCPDDGQDADELMRRADAALYDAKRAGGNACRFFAPSMEARVNRRVLVETRLREAIAAERLRLHYQPRVDVRTREILGFEALLRWEDEQVGPLFPAEAIHVAEETGLIVPLGRWALGEACRQAMEWRAAGLSDFFVSVNASPYQFEHDDLPGAVVEALQQSGLHPNCLEIEVTENLLLRDRINAALALHDLRAMGVRTALDDFGQGYSALSHLTRYPIDTLKLDGEFLQDAEPDNVAGRLLGGVIRLARDLGLDLVAEGVETDDQATFLWHLGCSQMQGHIFSPALPPEEWTRRISTGRLKATGEDAIESLP